MLSVLRSLWLCVPLVLISPSAQALPFSVYSALGANRYLDAEQAIEASVAGRAAHEVESATLAPLCYVYARLRRYGRLFDCADRLDARIRLGDIHHTETLFAPSSIEALPDALRAAASLELGNPADALARGRHAYARIRDERAGIFPPFAYRVEILPVLGLASVALGQRADAQAYIAQLQEIDIPYMGGQQFRNSRDVGLAKIHLALGNYAKALEYLDKGEHLALSRVMADLALGGGGDSFATYYALPKLLMRAKVMLETGKMPDARAALDDLLGHPRLPEQPDIHWVALFERGRVAEAQREPAAADFYRRAIEVIEQQRASLTTETAKIGFAGEKQRVYERLIALLLTADQVVEAFELVERAKSRALVDLLAAQKEFAVPGADAEATRQILARLDRAGEDIRAASAVNEAGGHDAQRTLTGVRQDITAAAPELASLVSVSAVRANEIQERLAADEQLVEYYLQGDTFWAFVVDQTSVRAVKLDPAGMATLVQQFRIHTESPAGQEWEPLARTLHARLLMPLAELLRAPRLIVVAHGPLHYLPYAALMDADGAMLIDRFSLRTLPAASVLRYLKPALGQAAAPALVLGNPDLDDKALDLAFAETEARAVAGLTPGSRLLLRKAASESNFRLSAHLFKRLHIASHGKFQADSPLASGLYLAPDAANDGVLRVGELYAMELNAELVTLSACETGLGKIDNGDDVVGLARGFLYAGARSILASLWSVDDMATANLMQGFYQALGRAGSAPEALRSAQQRVRRQHPHPFFWAAFQLSGRGD